MQTLSTSPFIFQELSTELPRPHLWYANQDAFNALLLFLDARTDLAGSLKYRFDLIDLDAVTAYQQKDAKSLDLHSKKFLQLVGDIETLFALDDNFHLGTWLESAKKLALNPSEVRQYEWNARTQVTMWFDTAETTQSKLHDYVKFYFFSLNGKIK